MHRFGEVLFRADQRVAAHHLLCPIPKGFRGLCDSLQVAAMDQYINVASYKRAATMSRKDMRVDGHAANHFEGHPGISKRVHNSFKVVYQHVHTRLKVQVYAAVFGRRGHELFKRLHLFAGARGRTHTPVAGKRILSPLCLLVND